MELDPLIYVIKSVDDSPVVRAFLDGTPYVSEPFFSHADAVILDDDLEVFFLIPSENLYRSAAAPVLDAVVKCVFDHRLNGELRDLKSVQALRYVNVELHDVLLSDLLDLKITSDVI